MDTNKVGREQFIKKLLYKSSYRGCKETDLILGNFAKTYLNKMSDSQLAEFADILYMPDTDFYDYYTNKKPVPKDKNTSIMKKLLDFKPSEK